VQELLADIQTHPLFWVFIVALLFYVRAGFNAVKEWERRPVLRFGKYARTLEPGITWLEPFTHTKLPDVAINEVVNSIELDTNASLQTRDNVPIAFTTVITSKTDAEHVKKFILAVKDGNRAVTARALAAVSEVVSRSTLDQLLHERDVVCEAIVVLLRERVKEWGILICAIELRDVKITDTSIQEAISLKARAAKEAEAEFVRAEAQVKIAKELNLAAAELSADGWRMKSMETMLEMTRSAENNTIVIPSDSLAALTSLVANK